MALHDETSLLDEGDKAALEKMSDETEALRVWSSNWQNLVNTGSETVLVIKDNRVIVLNLMCRYVRYGANPSDFVYLPGAIGGLTALRELKLMRCKKLKELSPRIGELKALTLLDLAGCSVLEKLPNEIGELDALTTLNFLLPPYLTTASRLLARVAAPRTPRGENAELPFITRVRATTRATAP